EIRGDDLVLDFFAVPERAFRNLGALDDSVFIAVSAYERGTCSIGYEVIRGIAMASSRKFVGAHAQHCFQIVFRDYKCARHSERGEDGGAAELIDADDGCVREIQLGLNDRCGILEEVGHALELQN